MNVFIIRSPFSYLNALEAQFFLKIEPVNSILIAFYTIELYQEVKQIKKILEHDHWEKIYFLPRNVTTAVNAINKNGVITGCLGKASSVKKKKHISYHIRKLNEVADEIGSDVENMIIQNINDYSTLHFVNKLKPECIFALDEGVRAIDTNRIRNQRLNDKLFFLRFDFIKRLLSTYFFQYKVREIDKVTFFTSYDIQVSKKDKVIKNDYLLTKRKLATTPRIIKTVYFFGSGLTEVGIMTEKIHHRYIKKVRDYFSDFHFVYIQHRGEKKRKLDALRSDLNIEIRNFDLPYEYMLYTGCPIPEIIASFCSSVLQNCYNIVGKDIKIISFIIQPKDIDFREKQIRAVYESFRINNIDPNFLLIEPSEYLLTY